MSETKGYDDKEQEGFKSDIKYCDEAKSSREHKGELNSKELVENIEAYFYTDDALALEFEKFVSDNCHKFTSIAHLEPGEIEFKLDYTEVYNEYKALFELKMENFIESQGVTVSQFFDILQEKSVKDKDSTEAMFGHMLLAVTEFDVMYT